MDPPNSKSQEAHPPTSVGHVGGGVIDDYSPKQTSDVATEENSDYMYLDANGNGSDDIIDIDNEIAKAEEGTYVSLQDVTKSVPAEPSEETAILKDAEASVKAQEGPGADLLVSIPRESSQHFTTDEPPKDTVEEELHELMEEYVADVDVAEIDPAKGAMKHSTTFGRDADKLLEKAKLMHYERKLRDNAKDTYDDFKSYLSLQKSSIWSYIKNALIVISIGTLVAVGIFYLGDRPEPSSTDASISWMVLFFAVRQVLTWSLAKATEAILIDFLCLRRPILLALMGPYLTLLLVQSKGFPFHMMAWSGYNFALLFGDRDLSKHWLYYQDYIEVFSPTYNPAGIPPLTAHSTYQHLILFCFLTGLAFTLKRFFMGLWYGRTVYDRFGKDLTDVLKKTVLLKKLAKYYSEKAPKGGKGRETLPRKSLDGMDFSDQIGHADDETVDESQIGNDDSEALVINFDTRDKLTGSLAVSQTLQIQTLLGEWEEPEIEDKKKVGKADISAIVQFRTAITCIDKQFPFSTQFGLADTRENAIDSAQKLYLRLKKDPADGTVPFTQIAVIALKDDKNNEDSLDKALVKELIKLFRPTREGELNMLDFLKSTDTVYKDLRMLQASILNLQKMQNAVQNLWNIIFYFFLGWMFLLALGVNPLAVIGSFTAVIVGFAFMVGNALSKTFEGLLFVLLRKPYDVGDRIAIASNDNEAPGGGSSGWIVKDVNLYTTTLVYGTTGEEATYTNGYLNMYRIINMNRSPKGVLSFVMKFGIKVSKEKIKTFGEEVEKYVKERPREWLAFSAYRLTNLEAERGYVEYKVVLQHRESWQQIGALLNSKADVQQFAFQLTKDLDMGYQSPPMPILLDQKGEGDVLEKLY